MILLRKKLPWSGKTGSILEIFVAAMLRDKLDVFVARITVA